MLLSGGLDSATVAALAIADGYEVYALTLLYGQRHGFEIEAAKNIARSLDIRDHRLVSVGLDAFAGSALTSDIEVPKDILGSPGTGIPITYVPARNTVFLSLALAFAESIGATDLFIGANAVDYSGYPDCRPDFIAQFENLANLATKAGVEGATFRIHAPLILMSKADIIRKALALGMDVSLTHSCYDPGGGGLPCGHCDACLLRSRAFAEVGVADPALKP